MLTLKVAALSNIAEVCIAAGAGAGGAGRGERRADRVAERNGPRQVRPRDRAAAPGQVRLPRHPLLRGEQSSTIQGRFCLGVLLAIAKKYRPKKLKGHLQKSATDPKRH